MKQKQRKIISKRYPCFLFTEKAVFLAQVNSKGDQFSIFRETVLPPGLINVGAVQDQKQLALFLSQLAKQSGLKETEVMVGLPELKATTQSVIIPQMASEEVDQAIENKSASFLPFPYEDAYVDWQFIERPKEGDMTVLVSAMPRVVVDGFIESFELAKLTPIAFETTATSLLRLIPSHAVQPAAALEYTGSNVVFIITQNGAITASSVLQDGPNVAERIDKMISYYLNQQENESTAIGSLYLAGKNISPQFASTLNQLLHVSSIMLVSNITNIARERQSELAVLASLTRKEATLPDDDVTINLLPDKKALFIEEQLHAKQERTRFLIALLFMCIFLIMNSISFITLKNKTENLAQEIADISTKQNSSLSFNPIVVDIIDDTAAENEKLSGLLTFLFDEAPQGIMLTGIQFDTVSGNILLTGKSTDRTTLLVYRDALGKRNEIKSVTIPLSSLEHEVDIEFRMQITL